ncbi:Formimidoyltetrahydrofolate cyclodeaminase [Quadrisphaera granulorum]|uniref:Formimidoyltetrahydrofolate cyclodeaminase n=1 Tax=Quadrisphaera granulorum TaxID=317664 RepID=A0A315ZRJ5_9ACTN|nr:cyclodeaminase/cyclohydrolase family protein [Quadrisphaera granulorum]PWJ48155.1 formimidoyltetrahydrofolate cyclodeaminase [Quadrisphaera granulorum]SZE98524.1 Formimidoyltetrahydrofolate cyclodeaminase [Quadrisphaera granulorum]
MSQSLWALSVADLLERTASSAPTPGGGSVAAVTGALGVGLVQMAVAVTGDGALDHHTEQLTAVRERVAAAADGDVADFEHLMAAYRLPRQDDDDARRRREAIEAASVRATEGPLGLVEALLDAVDQSHVVEPLVKRGVVSDVLAGRDLALGAARAGLRTADINIDALERLSSEQVPGLRERRDALVERLEEAA